jgi:hypothetical protein
MVELALRCIGIGMEIPIRETPFSLPGRRVGDEGRRL